MTLTRYSSCTQRDIAKETNLFPLSFFFLFSLSGFPFSFFYSLSPCLTSFPFDWPVQFNCINCVNFFSSLSIPPPNNLSLFLFSQRNIHRRWRCTHLFSITIECDMLTNMFNLNLSF